MLTIAVVVLVTALTQTIIGALLGMASAPPWSKRGVMDMVYIGGGILLGWAIYGR